VAGEQKQTRPAAPGANRMGSPVIAQTPLFWQTGVKTKVRPGARAISAEIMQQHTGARLGHAAASKREPSRKRAPRARIGSEGTAAISFAP
jgi:hypothetical protein